MTQLTDSLVFDLADTLTGNAENLTHFLQSVGAAVVHTKTHTQHICLTLGEGVQNFLQSLCQQSIGGGNE